MYSKEKQNAAFAHNKQHNTVDRETATAAAMWQPGQILCQKGQFNLDKERLSNYFLILFFAKRPCTKNVRASRIKFL